MPAIVSTGRPDEGVDYRRTVRPVFRRVDPPKTVVVDLGVVFMRQPFHEGQGRPDGLQMHAQVDGKLTCWGVCTDGMWWGLVTYPIQFGAKRRSVTHWIPAWMLKRY